MLIGSVRLSPPSFRAEFTIKTTQASPCPWNPIILSKEAQLTPSCIVMRPADTQHVALVIKTLSAINNLCSNQCQIAIRGGGHRPYAGSANIGNGIAVDLGLMNAVSVRSDRSITSVGPGSRWIDVYAKLDPMNLAMVGGRDNPVGVAGLSLGGESICLSSRDKGCKIVTTNPVPPFNLFERTRLTLTSSLSFFSARKDFVRLRQHQKLQSGLGQWQHDRCQPELVRGSIS